MIPRRTGSGRERAQATVELALVLPVVVVVLALVVQAGIIARDRVVVVHVTRSVAREVVTRPDEDSARQALSKAAVDARRYRVLLGGELRPGGLATVTVSARATVLPLLGRLIRGPELSERLVVRVEGPP